MFTRPAARRTAAALTAALVSVLLVTFGGHTRAPSHRVAAAGTSHAGSATKAARMPQAIAPAHHQQTPLHVDLTTTPPSDTSVVRPTVATAAAATVVVRLGREHVTPTGRAPPAL